MAVEKRNLDMLKLLLSCPKVNANLLSVFQYFFDLYNSNNL